MARMKGVGKEDGGLFVKLAYFFSRKGMKDMTGHDIDDGLLPIAIYAHSPSLLKGYGRMEQATAKMDAVDERARMLASLKTSTMVECEYCMDLGSEVARRRGISDEELLALPDYRSSDLFDDRDRAVLDYAVAMTRTPAEVTDELFARLREHFDERQMVELTHEIAIENHRARFNHAFGIGESGFSEGRVCVVPARETAAASAAGV